MPSPLSVDAHAKIFPALLVISALKQKAIIYVLIREIVVPQVWKDDWRPLEQRTGGKIGGNRGVIHILTEVITVQKLKGTIQWLPPGWIGAGMLRDLFHRDSPNTQSETVSTC